MKFRPSTGVLLTAGLILSACVDNDYDLSKDIDMNVTVGGNITIPASSTEKYTLSQILDLGENSVITPDGQLYGLSQGDYILVKEGNTSPSHFEIDKVYITDVKAEDTHVEADIVGTGNSANSVKLQIKDMINKIEFREDNVDRQIVSLKRIEGEVDFTFSLSFESTSNNIGDITINRGFTISFPQEWILTDKSSGMPVTLRDDNTLIFTGDKTIAPNSSADLKFTVSAIDLTKAPQGQGLYEPGHLYVNGAIVSEGDITLSNGSLAAGQSVKVTVKATPIVGDAVINSFTGIVNPDININSTSFEITDVPDFLKEPGNNLDVENPAIYLTINNTSPAEVELNATLTSKFSNGDADATVKVGSQNGTSPIVVKGNSTTRLCLSRTGEGTLPGVTNVKVANLGDLLSAIPESIEMSDIKASVSQTTDYTVKLGTNYGFELNYEIVVPLAFGPDLKFNYNTTDEGWDEELDKYNFSQVDAEINVINTIPLDMVPTVRALDRRGNVINNITATVTGKVKGGTISAPSTSTLTVKLVSTAENIGDLDGVQFEFDATSTPGLVGTPLNINQYLQFTDIRLKLYGGIDIDLN